jgi:hypothetical protein
MNGDNDDPDHFDPYPSLHLRVTKMPPLNKNMHQNSTHDSTHSSTHKNYSPLAWNAYFDELFYLSDVTPPPLRALQSSKPAMKELFSSASMERATRR